MAPCYCLKGAEHLAQEGNWCSLCKAQQIYALSAQLSGQHVGKIKDWLEREKWAAFLCRKGDSRLELVPCTGARRAKRHMFILWPFVVAPLSVYKNKRS